MSENVAGLKRFKPRKLRIAVVIDAVMRALFRIARIGRRSTAQDRTFLEVPQKILVVQGGGVGDVIMSLPALEALHARFPSAVTTVVAGPWARDLFKGIGGVQKIVGVHPPWLGRFSFGRTAGFWRTAFTLRRERFELGIDLQGDPRSLLFLYLSGAHHRVSYGWYGAPMGEYLLTTVVPGPAPHAHLVDRFLAVVGAIGCKAASRIPQLSISETERARAAAWRGEVGSGRELLVGIHPGAGNPLRLWKAERFARLMQKLVVSLDADVVVFAGPGEEDAAAGLVRQAGVGSVVSGISLHELAVRFTALDCLVALDSSASHIAAAVNIPVVSLFGPTLPGFGGPIGGGVRAVLQGSFECRPCTQERCVHPDASCMDAISADLVFNSVAAMVGERAGAKSSRNAVRRR